MWMRIWGMAKLIQPLTVQIHWIGNSWQDDDVFNELSSTSFISKNKMTDIIEVWDFRAGHDLRFEGINSDWKGETCVATFGNESLATSTPSSVPTFCSGSFRVRESVRNFLIYDSSLFRLFTRWKERFSRLIHASKRVPNSDQGPLEPMDSKLYLSSQILFQSTFRPWYCTRSISRRTNTFPEISEVWRECTYSRDWGLCKIAKAMQKQISGWAEMVVGIVFIHPWATVNTWKSLVVV